MGNTNSRQCLTYPFERVAVTDAKEDIFNFQWDINHFIERLHNEDYVLESPVFLFGKNKCNRLQWQVKVGWMEGEGRGRSPDGNLSLYLFLVSAKKPIFAEFQCELLGEGQTSLRRFGADIFIPKQGQGFEKFLPFTALIDADYKWLENDTLKLRFEVKIKKDLEATKADNAKSSLQRKLDLLSNLNDLLQTQMLADLSIQTKTSLVKAHKAILSCQSPVFSIMLQSNMYEGINNHVEIREFDEEVVNGMLQYIYGGKISLECMAKNSHELFQIANKYDIKGLQEEAEEHIEKNLAIINVVDALILADMNTAVELKSKAMNFINQNKAELKKIGELQKILNYNRSLIEELYLLE